MLQLAAFYVIGYDIGLLALGTLREMMANGGLFGLKMLPISVPTVSSLFGGFIVLAILSAGFRWISARLLRREEAA